uniref:Uncharacterized protein n=1 Tax=Lepeophtheirus salmonis TaxID=72036 RepID=A0A0K2UVY1_LEPSM
MGNCFNRQQDSFVKHSEIQSDSMGGTSSGAKLNTLMVLAEEEKKSYSGHAGLPNLVSLAENESKSIKSPEKQSTVSPAQQYEKILSTPPESPETKPKSNDSKEPLSTKAMDNNLSAFNPEDSDIFHHGDDKNPHLVMIDEFSEEEVHEEEDANNNKCHLKDKSNSSLNGEELNDKEEKLAPLATAE